MSVRILPLFPLIALILGTASSAAPVGRWEFDGTLADASGNGRAALAPGAQFAKTAEGQALASGTMVEIPHTPPLRLYPQLDIRCRFRLDALAEGVQILLQKDQEYLLRVDWAKESGHLSFFVFVDGGWEPRLRSLVPEVGPWYDVRAGWDGSKLMLDVNGKHWSRPRAGAIAATDNPVQVGPIAGLIDRVEIRNPGYCCEQTLLRASREDVGGIVREARFGGPAGWQGWRGVAGATCEIRNSTLQARFAATDSMLIGPALAAEAAKLPFVCLDIAAPEGTVACLHFLSDAGVGAIPFHPLRDGRSTMLEVASHPKWQGRIRRLALSAVTDQPATIAVSRLVASDRHEGKPYFYIRSFAPEHAKLRPGRPEKIIAAVKNLGGFAENVRAELHLPGGVTAIDGTVRTLQALPASSFDLVSWTVQAGWPVKGKAILRVTAPQGQSAEQELDLAFEALPTLPRTDYVPIPQPATTDYIGLMHYCALWKEGTHYGWGRIEPWPDRRPAIGYYDEGTPEVADWHIKYAIEHGINAFIYCWYRADLKPEITHFLGHAIHEGLYHARYRDQFQFCIMWENGCAKGVKDADDLLTNLLPFWIENYFSHPSYLRIDDRPVLFVWRPEKVGPQLGGTEGTNAAIKAMRAAMRRAGFKGIRLIGCLNQANVKLQERLAAEGWDATSGYALTPQASRIVGADVEGIPYMDHGEVLALSREEWEARRDMGSLPDVPNVMMGWDPRPWHGTNTRSYRANPKPEHFEAACREAKELVDAAPADAWYRRLVVFDNWTEFGEGHYVEPTSGTGFDYVNAIKRVFCKEWAPEAVTDVIPEDLGLEPPQKRYMASRMLYGGLPWRPRVVRDNLVAYWRFDSDNEGLFLDSSSSAFHLARHDAPRVPGRSGQAIECGEGWGNHPAHAEFSPPTGVTISLWCNPSTAKQSDRWMLNCVGRGSDGYRLGMAGGKVAWQVPRERWSHNLHSPEPIPVGAWTHVAATFNNRTMVLYLNGKQVGELERPGLIRPSRGDLNIGTYGGTRARFQGLLDEIRLYNRPLSPQEIAKLAEE